MPEELRPLYTTPEANTPVHLYTGSVEIFRTGDTYRKDAEVSLAWLPSPRVEIRVVDFLPPGILDGSDEWRVSIPGRAVSILAHWTSANVSSGTGAEPARTIGRLYDNDTFAGCELNSVVFHVANGTEYIGAPVHHHDGPGASASRAVLEAAPWRITFDAIRQWQGDNTRRSLRALGGYAITHVGRLERIDGRPFTGEDADRLIESLGWLLSLCRGAWTFPLLLAGEDTDSQERRDIWRCLRIDADAAHRSWFNQLSSEGFSAFPGLVARLGDPTWNEPVRHALHWYIVCNKPRPVSIEGAIVLQQAAFELLAWTLLVEDHRVPSEDGIQKLPASDRIRLMLSTCDIPLDIPPDLSDLVNVAKAENWQDGPRATTEIRNAIVHASPKKRARILAHGPNARTDAWTLGQWYLELVLLHLFGYTGHYSNRLRRSGWRGTEVEPIPWAK